MQRKAIPMLGSALLLAALPLFAESTAPAAPAAPATAATIPAVPAAPDLSAKLAFVPEVVATFGEGKTVKGADLKKMLLPALRMAAAEGQLPDDKQLRGFAAQFAERLVEIELIKELCAKDGMKPDLTAAAKTLAEKAGGEDKLAMMLATQGFDKKDLVDMIGVEMMVQSWVETKLKPGIKIADDAVQKFYESNKEQFAMPATMSASHILVKIEEGAAEADKKAAKAKAEQILADLKKGGDFAKLAAEKSDCPSGKQNGGSLGSFPKGQMVPEFEEAASKLKKDELSGIVETQFGYHIIKGGETKPAGMVPLDQVKARIQEMLVGREINTAMEKKLADMRKEANVKVLLPVVPIEQEKTAAPAEDGKAAAPAK